MKKYFIIFCSLLIMIISLFFVSPVFAASGALFNRIGVDYRYYYTSIDNLEMVYLGETGQETNFFTSSTNCFPITDTETISTSCAFNSSSTDITIQLDSRDTKYFNNIHDTMVNYSNLGQSSYIYFIQCYYGEFFMPINRDWINSNSELRYLVEFNTPTILEVDFSVSGYYPVLTENGFYMQPFNFDDVVALFDASESHEFSLYSLLTDYVDYSQYLHNNFLYITNACFQIDTSGTNEISAFSYYFNKLKNWQLPSIDDYNVSLDIDISPFGTALLNGVTNFLRFEIIPGFSLLDLLFYCCAVPLLIAILKIFLGG